jgi:hypothetical protein
MLKRNFATTSGSTPSDWFAELKAATSPDILSMIRITPNIARVCAGEALADRRVQAGLVGIKSAHGRGGLHSAHFCRLVRTSSLLSRSDLRASACRRQGRTSRC